jgi:hypothetical protein
VSAKRKEQGGNLSSSTHCFVVPFKKKILNHLFKSKKYDRTKQITELIISEVKIIGS